MKQFPPEVTYEIENVVAFRGAIIGAITASIFWVLMFKFVL